MDESSIHLFILQVGIFNGAYVMWVDTAGRMTTWKRLGTLAEMPPAPVQSITWDATSDTLVISTLGRGIYLMNSAAVKLRQV
jgi:hypothetical protein